MITIKPTMHGLKIDCNCVWQHGVNLTPERCDDNCDLTGLYLQGRDEPHFPVPCYYGLYFRDDPEYRWMEIELTKIELRAG